jgi:hypothetical protein
MEVNSLNAPDSGASGRAAASVSGINTTARTMRSISTGARKWLEKIDNGDLFEALYNMS